MDAHIAHCTHSLLCEFRKNQFFMKKIWWNICAEKNTILLSEVNGKKNEILRTVRFWVIALRSTNLMGSNHIFAIHISFHLDYFWPIYAQQIQDIHDFLFIQFKYISLFSVSCIRHAYREKAAQWAKRVLQFQERFLVAVRATRLRLMTT